jgi:Na+-driven multidrug efflux pump
MAKPLLQAMGTPDDVLEQAALYMKIYFLGMPASMIFNFSSAILRAVGDTRRPLYFLSISGVLNVALNLLFVIAFHLDIAGVAVATVISQYLSIVLILLCLLRPTVASGYGGGRFASIRISFWLLLK